MSIRNLIEAVKAHFGNKRKAEKRDETKEEAAVHPKLSLPYPEIRFETKHGLVKASEVPPKICETVLFKNRNCVVKVFESLKNLIEDEGGILASEGGSGILLELDELTWSELDMEDFGGLAIRPETKIVLDFDNTQFWTCEGDDYIGDGSFQMYTPNKNRKMEIFDTLNREIETWKNLKRTDALLKKSVEENIDVIQQIIVRRLFDKKTIVASLFPDDQVK